MPCVLASANSSPYKMQVKQEDAAGVGTSGAPEGTGAAHASATGKADGVSHKLLILIWAENAESCKSKRCK